MAEKPRFRHNCKTAVFLGSYSGEDLWYQQGQVVARFGSDPQDFVMAGTERSSTVDSLREAVKRAAERHLEMDTGEQTAVVVQLTTSELLALSCEEDGPIQVTRDGHKHTVHALMDGRVIDVEAERWETTTKEFMKTYPDALGEIWEITQAIPDEEDDDDE